VDSRKLWFTSRTGAFPILGIPFYGFKVWTKVIPSAARRQNRPSPQNPSVGEHLCMIFYVAYVAAKQFLLVSAAVHVRKSMDWRPSF
jgi:hypothetical protein